MRRVNVADTTDVLTAAEGADMVWIESPTNPTIEVADLPTLGQNLSPNPVFVVDNTFATPLLQRPLESGADIVLHSATKLLSGHSDVVLGAIVTRADDTQTFDALDASVAPSALLPVQWRPILRCVACVRCRCDSRRLRQAPTSSPNGCSPIRACSRVRFPGTSERSWSRPRAAHHVWLWLADLNRSSGREDGRGVRRWLLAVGVCHQPRWSRVHAGAAATLEGEFQSVPEGLVRMSVGIEHVEDLWDRSRTGSIGSRRVARADCT